MKVLFTESDFWDSNAALQQKYNEVIGRAFQEVRALLPQVPKEVTFVVQPAGYDCIPETGEYGYTKNAYLIILSLDPGLPFGKSALLKRLRLTVFHELNHSARFMLGLYHTSFLETCMLEGLATVFERDRGPGKPLWAQYTPAEAKRWLVEITNKTGGNARFYEYMYRHTDGRRWIGYKVGTYIVDTAHKKSGKSIEELTTLPCEEIKRLAGIE